MPISLKLPFSEYLYACFEEYRKELPEGRISPKLWVEKCGVWHDAWHDYHKPKRAPKEPFQPPTAQEVTDYSISIGWPLDGESWCLGYATKDWCTSGSARMRDWKSAVKKWKRDQIHTKLTPKGPETDAGPTEPPDWLSFMRRQFPEWVRLNGNQPTPTWKALSKDERTTILEKMAHPT